MQFLSGRRRSAQLIHTAIASVVFFTPLAAVAQNATLGSDGVGVARVSLIEGNVAVQRGDSAESLAAALNAPVLGGDYLTTGDRSRTEIEFDGSSQLRLGAGTQVRFTRLDTGVRTIQLAAGTLELRLLRNSDGTSEIDTPSISIKPQERGAYRVTVTPDGQTLVTVRSGQAEIDTPRGGQDVLPGSTFIAQGDATDPSTQTVAATASDEFDTFNAERDRIHARALGESAFLNADVGGVADLAANGRWVTDGSYGHVWIPASVAPDWAPYRNGRWVWEDGYGWTWVGAEPWGWAPYHYGSWYHNPNYGWCWYPPQPHLYAPWRPALVAFIGFGEGAGFSLGFGGENTFENVGWVPLAPYEAYHPWWGNGYGGGNTTIVNTITTVTNNTYVTNNSSLTNVNVYRNVRYNAVSSVTSQRFLQGNFSRNAVVSGADLRHATVFRSTLPIVPTASNLRFTSSAERPAIPVRSAIDGRNFAGNTNVVHRTAFAAQRVALSSATRTPITPLHFIDARTTPIVQQRGLINPSGPNRLTVIPAAPARPVSPADPWARFNHSRATGTARPSVVTAPTLRGTYAKPGTPPAPVVRENPSAPLAPNAYHQPTNPKTDRTPFNANVYHAPANPNIYHGPPNANTDRAPANAETNRAPINANVYHAPANANTYHAPASANVYHAPANANTYHAIPEANVVPNRPRSFDGRAAGQRDLQPNRIPTQAAPPPHASEPPPHAAVPERHEAPRTTEQTHPEHPPSHSQQH